MAEQEKTVQRTFRFDEQTTAMLRDIAEYYGTSMADVVRRMIKNGFREKFGEHVACSTCLETHIVKNPLENGWSSIMGDDKAIAWTCPRCRSVQIMRGK